MGERGLPPGSEPLALPQACNHQATQHERDPIAQHSLQVLSAQCQTQAGAWESGPCRPLDDRPVRAVT